MSTKIPIETSARHIHLSEADFHYLFGDNKELHYIKELSQPGQYLCEERLTVKGPRDNFENMAILGPFRKESQVELSLTDTRKAGIPGIIRQSGDIKGTPGCTLIGPCGELVLPQGVIVAKRHIHMTPADAITLKVKDNQEVFVLTKSYGRALIYADVVVRVSWNFRLAMHVDTDEANAFSSDADPFGVIVKLFDENYNTDMWIEEVLTGIQR
ncbi:MAG: phosphate propanoyltransferase [Blautia sp.]|nr:phosphate propanoyltransferase [Blautia sp.]